MSNFFPAFLWFLDILCLPDQLNKFLSVCAHSQALAIRLPIYCLSRLCAALLRLVHTSGHTWSSLAVVWTFESLHLDRTCPWGGFSFNMVNFVNPVHESDKFPFSSTVHKSSMRFSCMTSRFVWVHLVTSVYLFQWNRECLFLRHVELNSRFSMMTINEVTLNWPKVIVGFSVIFWFCWSRLFRFPLKSSTEMSTPHSMFPPWMEWVLRIRSLFQTISLHHLQMGKWIILPFVRAVRLSHWLVAEKICFSISSRSANKISPFQILPRDQCISKKYST